MSIRRSAWAIYDIFECRDQGQVFVGVVSDTLWKAFCKEFGLEALGQDESLVTNSDRVTNKERILDVIVPLFQGLTVDEASNRLEHAGIPFAPINRPADLFDDPHLSVAGGLVEVTLRGGKNDGRTVHLPALPLEMAGEKLGVWRDLPEQGRDTVAVLREAKYCDAEIEALLEQGTVAN